MNTILEIKLRDQFLDGNPEAYAAMYRLYAKDLYSFGLSLTNEKELIEDAIHDVFTTLYSRKELLKNINNIKVYFIVSFRNRLIHLLKKNHHMTDWEPERYEDISTFDLEEEWIEKEEEQERMDQINSLFECLTTHQKEIVYHRYIDGRSCKEISKIMGLSYQSVKNLLHRSVNKIKMVKSILMIFVILLTQLIKLV